MENIKRVSIRRRSTTAREYIAIVVNTHDLELCCDLVNKRQLGLARLLAADHGIELEIHVPESELPQS